MKKWALISVLVFLVSMLYGQNKVPDIKLKRMNGKSVMLQDFLKKGPVLINFWATWCAPCKKEMVHLDEFEKKYTDKGLSVLAISIDSQKSISQVRSYIRAKKLNGNLMPTDILIGQDGTILWRHNGYIPGDEKKIEAEIKAAVQSTS